MSDPEDKTDIYRDRALNQLISTIDSTGGLVTEEKPGTRATWLVPKGDTEREWADLADAYLDACKAMKLTPLIDGKRRPNVLKVTVQIARSVEDEISDEENERETVAIHAMFDGLHEDVAVDVVDCDGTYLYDAHREV